MRSHSKGRSRRVFRLTALLAAAASLLALPVAAKSDFAHDTILSEKTGRAAVIPETHECVQRIAYIEGYRPNGDSEGLLNAPQDIFVDRQDNIYIADTGNNAVVKLDPSGKLVFAITEESGGLHYPLGVYVDDRQEIFVADNGNARVAHFDASGRFVEEFVAPETELLGQNLTAFDPTKLAINDYNGYIYLLIGKEFLTLDAKNRFRGLVGTEPVGFDLADWLVRMLATDLQKEKIKKREPVSYNNFCITYDNKIYAVSMAETNQIKKINSSGDSLFPSGTYGERSKDPDTGKMLAPMLSDIAVDSGEMITVADQRTAKLYQYTVDGELLAVFGGKGSTVGRFDTIAAIAYNTKDELLVLDAGQNSVQKLRPTAFMQAVHDGIAAYRAGDYAASLQTWDKIGEQVSCYPVAQTAIANIYYKQGRYAEAQAEYREAGDRTGYAKAFGELRRAYTVKNFNWLVPLIVVGLAAALWLVLYMRRYCVLIEEDLYRPDISAVRAFFGMCQLSFFHPVQAWDVLRRRQRRQSWLPVVVLPVLTVFVRLLSSAATAFPVASIESWEVSFWYELLLVAVPYVTFGLMLFKISGVLSGEMTACETFSSVAYAFVPMIVTWPLLTLLSHVVTAQEMGIYFAVRGVVYVWVALGLLSAVQRVNDVSLARAVGLTLLGLLGTAVVWALCALIYIFTAQLGFFVKDLWQEIVSRIYGL